MSTTSPHRARGARIDELVLRSRTLRTESDGLRLAAAEKVKRSRTLCWIAHVVLTHASTEIRLRARAYLR